MDENLKGYWEYRVMISGTPSGPSFMITRPDGRPVDDLELRDARALLRAIGGVCARQACEVCNGTGITMHGEDITAPQEPGYCPECEGQGFIHLPIHGEPTASELAMIEAEEGRES